MTDTNAEYLRYLCREYIRAIEQGIGGDFYRVRIHNMIEKRVILDEDELEEILYNLDRHIGYMPPQGEDKAEYWGNKLFEAIKAASVSKIYDMLRDGDTREFLKTRGIEFDEWAETWIENGMEVLNKMPVLKKR